MLNVKMHAFLCASLLTVGWGSVARSNDGIQGIQVRDSEENLYDNEQEERQSLLDHDQQPSHHYETQAEQEYQPHEADKKNKRKLSMKEKYKNWLEFKKQEKIRRKTNKQLLIRDRQEFLAFDQINSEQFGPELWKAINRVSIAATTLIEKRYNGEESVFAGVGCLMGLKAEETSIKKAAQDLDLDYKFQLMLKIRDIADECELKLQNFKELKKKKKIKRLKSLSPSSQLNAELGKLSPALFHMIQESLRSNQVACSKEGVTMSGAFLFAASVSGQRLKCKTVLGLRSMYGVADMRLGIGFGGSITAPEGKTYTAYNSKIRNDSSAAKFDPSLNLSVGVGAMIGSTERFSTNQSECEFGVGAGILSFPIGIGGIFKIKELKPDFRKLYKTLDIGILQVNPEAELPKYKKDPWSYMKVNVF